MQITEGQKSILSHGESPTTILRLGKGLDRALIDFAKNPEKLLQEAIKSLISQQGKTELADQEKLILTAFVDEWDKPENQKLLEDKIGKMEVTFNKSTRQKMSLGDWSSHASVASIMYQHDVRTICSISGTTVDTVVGMTLSLGKENMQKILRPIVDYSQKYISPNLDLPPSLDTPEGENFKQVLTSISFFMQTGQYHTAGEVLGGLFIAARGLSTSETENIDIGETFKMFEGLMKEFSETPEVFFATPEEDKKKINENLPTVMKALEKQQHERILLHQTQAAKRVPTITIS